MRALRLTTQGNKTTRLRAVGAVMALVVSCKPAETILKPSAAERISAAQSESSPKVPPSAAVSAVPIARAMPFVQPSHPSIQNAEGAILFAPELEAFSTSGPISPRAGTTQNVVIGATTWVLQVFSMWSRGIPSGGLCGAAKDSFLTLRPKDAKKPLAYIVLESVQHQHGAERRSF